MRVPADFNAQGLADQSLEGAGLPGRGPQLELRVAARAHLQQRVLAAVVKGDIREAL
jgi:hypothetical protein